MILVPSRSWTAAFATVNLTPLFRLLGPFYVGQYITKIEVGMSGSAGLTARWGMVVTESNNASVDAWRSGVPILQSSDVVGDGQPVFETLVNANRWPVMTIGVGLAVRGGPKYIVCRALGSHGASFIHMYFTAFCVEALKLAGENGTV